MSSQRPFQELENDELVEYHKIQEIAKKHDLQLDSDTDALVKFIVKGGHVEGIEKLTSKSWLLNQAIKFWGQMVEKNIISSVRQRAFEYICELAGHMKTGEKNTASQLVDVIIDAVKK